MASTLLSTCNATNGAGLERTRFYARQLVTPDDLTQDQVYFREKTRRHNRLLHGWGVVCGARVRKGKEDCEVVIEPGFILGPYGDEIHIPEPLTLDVCELGSSERAGCGDDTDVWCTDVRADCEPGTRYLAIRYAECDARPVKAMAACGCGCGDTACEYSRIRESYVIRVLDELPSTYSARMPRPSFQSVLDCRRLTARGCPECPDEPWVILADLAIGKDCSIQEVDCWAHRRIVLSFADFFITCAGSTQTLQPGYTGMNVLELLSGTTSQQARASVVVESADGSPAMLTAGFDVEPGETLASLLRREGDSSFDDPASGKTFTLRDLYALAGADLDTTLSGTASALAPLEGLALGGDPADAARLEIRRKLDRGGTQRVERDLAGDYARAAELPATLLSGVSERSALGQHLASMTIAELAEVPREQFIAQAAELAPNRASAARRQAEEVWDAASAVALQATRLG